jgi:DNA helicase-2/ATP-dependent DNA helicase PcrA
MLTQYPSLIFLIDAHHLLQDVNMPQYELVRLLRAGAPAGSVTVVGDPDQAIYTWRGASPANMERAFQSDFGADCVTVHLKDNYR